VEQTKTDNMQRRLEGKVAIITGAGAGIGEAIAHKFALEGAVLVLNGLPDDPVEEVAAAIRLRGGNAVSHLGDISEELYARQCVQLAIDTYRKIDILVNNAGVLPYMAETQDLPVEAFEMMIKNNVRSAFLMTKYALPHLQKTHGNIVSAGSEAGFNGLAECTPYGGTKGWMHSFMMGVAVEQAKHGVRANCICPGPVDTAWTHKDKGPMDKKTEKLLIEATPMARRGTTEEIANVYAFIASDEASYVTGALWLVDGGITPAKGPVGKQTPSSLASEPKGKLDLSHQRDGGHKL